MSISKVAVVESQSKQPYSPVQVAIDREVEAWTRVNDAKFEYARAKEELVQVAISINAFDALSVNVARLRKIAGLR